MPLKSAAQAAYLKNNKPKVFKEFKNATPKGSKLPQRVRKGSMKNTVKSKSNG